MIGKGSEQMVMTDKQMFDPSRAHPAHLAHLPATILPISLMVLVALMAVAAGGCTPKVRPAGPPLRPPIQEQEQQQATIQRTDCDRVTVGDDKPAFRYEERSIEEARNLANQGFATLRAAETRGVPRRERERMITNAVEDLITALLADPYNVHATYNLAAAYARIGRPQCSVNLLSRLVALRRLPSQTAKVEAKLDRLLGRKKFNGRLDPDFEKLRDDRRFRNVVKELQR